MCGSCGCENTEGATIVNLQTGRRISMSDAFEGAMTAPGDVHAHAHDHSHDHHHGGHDHGHEHHTHSHHHSARERFTAVDVETRLLEKNDAIADQNRAWFAGREILALNLVSSPGAGKTTLLERTIRDLRPEMSISVIEGDQATTCDGERIRAAGAPAVQVNTGTGCHLEADMVLRAVRELKPEAGSLLLIENVGNLVCPALFDLGEHAKVVILSVTEGEDKPLKYPHMFLAAELMIINKIDLLPHVDFDLSLAVGYARDVNPQIEVLSLSARTGQGLDGWYEWLRRECGGMKAAAFA
jgi:hydrogenase nickel incorporation protein HypB